MKTQITCKHGNSQNFSKQGFRKTDHRGKIQKYYCKDCKRFFTKDKDCLYLERRKDLTEYEAGQGDIVLLY